jgi:hypothetical protein
MTAGRTRSWRWRAAALVCVGAAGVFVACDPSGDDEVDSTATTGGTPTSVAAVGLRLGGIATLDGAPLDADFVGAYVMRDGMVTSCQLELPAVSQGLYAVPVASEAAMAGCGAAGREIVLWTSVGGQFLFSQTTLAWPEGVSTASFDAGFSSGDIDGAVAPHTPFGGESIVRSDGENVEAGTLIEAYVGETLCGVASVREGGDFTVLVAGPQVAGCAEGGEVAFVVGGETAVETGINDLRRDREDRQPFELTLP